MGEEETATDYCNWARRIFATMRMAGMHYSTALYLTHVIKELTSSYNLPKRLSLAPTTRATLNKDSLTSYILQDEAMQEAEWSSEFLLQVNYVARAKQGGRPGQRGQSGGGGSNGWKPTKDANKKSAKNSGCGGVDVGRLLAGRNQSRIVVVAEEVYSESVAVGDGSNTEDVLAVVHIDLCGTFRVAAKDGSLYFLLLKDRKIRYVWRHVKKSVLMLRSDQGGAFLGKDFTAFKNGKGIVHDLNCPYTPQQNGMAEREWEMRTAMESVRTMLLHIGMQRHWWHLALRQAVWVCNCLERSTLPPGTMLYQLLSRKKPDLSLARVWGCVAQFLVPEQRRGGKLKPKAKWGLHLGNMSLEMWNSEHGPASGRTPTTPLTDTSAATLPLLAKVGELANAEADVVRPPSPPPAPPVPPLMADLRGLTRASASGDEGRSGVSLVALAKSIADGRHDVQQVNMRVKSTPAGEEQAELKPPVVRLAKGALARQQPTGEQKSAGMPAVVQQDAEGSDASEEEAEQADAEESTDSNVVEVGPRWTSRLRRPLDFFVLAAFTTVYDEVDDDVLYADVEEDEDLPKLDPHMHATPSTIGIS
ncbi:unnamed protein product [Closterium sp. NIES-53]